MSLPSQSSEFPAISMNDPQNPSSQHTAPQESTLPVNNEFKEPVHKKRKYDKKLKSVVPEVKDSQKVLQPPQKPLSLAEMVYEDAIRDPWFVLFRDKLWLNQRLNKLNLRLENYIRNTESRTSQPLVAPPSSSNPPLRPLCPLPNLPFHGARNLPPLIRVKNLPATVPLSQLLSFPTPCIPSTALSTSRFPALLADSQSKNESPTI